MTRCQCFYLRFMIWSKTTQIGVRTAFSRVNEGKGTFAGHFPYCVRTAPGRRFHASDGHRIICLKFKLSYFNGDRPGIVRLRLSEKSQERVRRGISREDTRNTHGVRSEWYVLTTYVLRAIAMLTHGGRTYKHCSRTMLLLVSRCK